MIYNIYIYIYHIQTNGIYIWNISPISIVFDYPLMIGTALPSAWRSSGYSPVINHGLLENPPFIRKFPANPGQFPIISWVSHWNPPFRPGIFKCHVWWPESGDLSICLVADFLKEFLARCCQCSYCRYCLILLFSQIPNDLSKLLFFAIFFLTFRVSCIGCTFIFCGLQLYTQKKMNPHPSSLPKKGHLD